MAEEKKSDTKAFRLSTFICLCELGVFFFFLLFFFVFFVFPQYLLVAV